VPPRRLSIPVRGVSDTTGFIDQAGDLNPPDVLRNFRIYDGLTNRARGGMRPTLLRLWDTPLGNGPIQALCKVNRPSVSTGYVLGDSEEMALGSTNGTTNLTGNHWALDQVPSLEWAGLLQSTAAVAPPSPQVNAECLTPNGEILVVAGSAKNGAYLELKVRGIDPATGATLWTYTYSDGAADWYVTAVCASNDWVFVCTRGEVFVLWAHGTNKGLLAQRSTCNGWADITTGCGIHVATAGGGQFTTTHLTVSFYGSSRPGTIVGGTLADGSTLGTTISVGLYASHFRSGIMRFRVAAYPGDNPAPPPTYTVLTQITFGTQLSSSDPRYEAAHGYYRISEQSRNSPHGCYPTDLDVHPTLGTVLFSRTNQGWGPTDAWRPTGTDGRPFITLVKLTGDGETQWEMDPGSNTGDGTTGSGYYLGHPHFNDINDPTFVACCFGNSGECWIGGKKTALAGFSVFRVSANGGTEFGQNVMDATRSVRKEAMRVDPSDGNLIVGGDRNTGWEGASGDNAHLWKVNADTGDIVWAWDIGEAVSALALAVSSAGKMYYGTDYAP